jgi:O-antigen ligase
MNTAARRRKLKAFATVSVSSRYGGTSIQRFQALEPKIEYRQKSFVCEPDSSMALSFFYWLVALMPLENHWLWGHILFGNFTVIKGLGVVCLLIALYRLATSHISLKAFYGRTGRWCLLFVLTLSLAAIHSLSQSVLEAWSHVFSILSLLVTVLTLVTSRGKLNRTLLVAIGGAGFASLYTIRQQQHYGAGIEEFRAGGMSGDPNYYALLVGLWIPLTFLWVFSSRPRWERLLCGGCLFAMLIGSIIAASRGGTLGLAAAFVYLILRSEHRIRNLLAVGILIIPLMFLLLLLPSSPLHRLTHPNAGDRFAEQARLIAWKSGIRMVKAHPLAGVGLHNFKPVILQYEDTSWLTETNNYQPIVNIAHNTYVELAAETGLLGLLFFLGVLVGTFRTLEHTRRQAQGARCTHMARIALGLQAGLLCFAVSAFFLSDWWERMFWLLIFLSICLQRLLKRELVRNSARDAQRLAHSVLVGASA